MRLRYDSLMHFVEYDPRRDEFRDEIRMVIGALQALGVPANCNDLAIVRHVHGDVRDGELIWPVPAEWAEDSARRYCADAGIQVEEVE